LESLITIIILGKALIGAEKAKKANFGQAKAHYRDRGVDPGLGLERKLPEKIVQLWRREIALIKESQENSS
jgi:hypothetical protein